MTKREFMQAWTKKRTASIRAAHAGVPHGAASLAMALSEIPTQGERFWRKHRDTLRHYSVTSVFITNKSHEHEVAV